MCFRSVPWKLEARTSMAKRRRAARRGALAHRFAAKFVIEADFAIKRGLLLEWWKLAKDSAVNAAVQKHLEDIEAGREIAAAAEKVEEDDVSPTPPSEGRSSFIRTSIRDVVYRSVSPPPVTKKKSSGQHKRKEQKKPSRCDCVVM